MEAKPRKAAVLGSGTHTTLNLGIDSVFKGQVYKKIKIIQKNQIHNLALTIFFNLYLTFFPPHHPFIQRIKQNSVFSSHSPAKQWAYWAAVIHKCTTHQISCQISLHPPPPPVDQSARYKDQRQIIV